MIDNWNTLDKSIDLKRMQCIEWKQFIENNAYNKMYYMSQVNSYRSLSQSCDFYFFSNSNHLVEPQ